MIINYNYDCVVQFLHNKIVIAELNMALILHMWNAI